MPDLSSYLADLRAGDHSLRAYLSIYKPRQVLGGVVSADVSEGDTAISYTIDSQWDASDVKAGFRVDVFTSAGVFKGRTRVRFSGSITSSSLPIREHSQGLAVIEQNDVIKVYEEIRLTDKLVTDDGTFSPDGITYTDQWTSYRPIPSSGTPWAGFVDSGTSTASVQFVGSDSERIGTGDVFDVSHSWTFPPGSTPTSTTIADPSASIPVGNWLVEHTVTDNVNSETWTQYVPVIVHNDNNPPYECIITSLEGDETLGWAATVQVFEDATLDDIPDGSLAILWVEEFINNKLNPIPRDDSWGTAVIRQGSMGREHIKLTGYLRHDSFRGDADLDEITFDIISPLALLDEINSSSKAWDSTNLTGWQIGPGNTRHAIVGLLRFYTTFFEAGWDFTYRGPNGLTTAYSPDALFLQAQSVLSQIREISRSSDYRLTNIREGRFHLCDELALVSPLSTRDSLTTTITLDTDDILEYSCSREHMPPLSMYRARGFDVVGGVTTAIFARWPSVPMAGTQTVISDGMYYDAADDMRERTGMRGAQVNGAFFSSANEYYTVSDLDITLFGSYDVFDFWEEYIEFALDDTSNLRGFDFSALKWILRSVNITYENQTATVELTLRPATYGNPGVDDSPPA